MRKISYPRYTFGLYGLEEDATDTVGIGSPSFVAIDLEETIKSTFSTLDISASNAFSPHMSDIDKMVKDIADMFTRIEDTAVCEQAQIRDAWKWSESGDTVSKAIINDILTNTSVVLDKFITVNETIYSSFGGYKKDNTEISMDEVSELNEILKSVNHKFVISGYITDHQGSVSLITEPLRIQVLSFTKKDVDGFIKSYQDILDKFDKLKSHYDKCRKKFLTVRNDEKQISNVNLSNILSIFTNITGTFLLLKRLSGLDFGNLLMGIKKGF